jgi:hypothetical protein
MLKLKVILPVAIICIVGAAIVTHTARDLNIGIFGLLPIFYLIVVGTIGAVMSFAPDAQPGDAQPDVLMSIEEDGLDTERRRWPIRFAIRWNVFLVYLMVISAAIIWTCGTARAAPAMPETTACHLGYHYLAGPDGLAWQANQSLRTNQVRSRGDPTRLVADVVLPEAVASTFVVEQLSPDYFEAETAESGKIRLICAVLAEYGRLGNAAYRTKQSSRGYYGRAQMGFIYNDLVSEYSEASLIVNRIDGLRDPLNSALAVTVHGDAVLASLSRAARGKMKTDEWRNRAMMVGYKLGYAPVSLAIEKCGADWRSETKCVNYRINASARQYLEMSLLVRKVFEIETARVHPDS